MSDSKKRTIECDSHGTVPWEGDLVCAHCGRIYFDCHNNPMPQNCECCGHPFSPSAAGGGDFTARVVCHACALQKKAGN